MDLQKKLIPVDGYLRSKYTARAVAHAITTAAIAEVLNHQGSTTWLAKDIVVKAGSVVAKGTYLNGINPGTFSQRPDELEIQIVKIKKVA